MTQQPNGGANPDDVKPTAQGGSDVNNDGAPKRENDIKKELESLKTELEALKKESSGKDSKIAKLLKEQEISSLSTKTQEEQLEHYKAQAALYARKEAFRQSFKENSLNADDFMEIVDEKDPKIQAEKFAKLLKAQTEQSAKTALEAFKKEVLAKKGDVPKPKNPQNKTNADVNASIRSAFGR